LLQCWQGRNPAKDSNRQAKAFFVPREEIAANSYDLSINRYKEIAYEEVTYEPPKVILQKLRSLEKEIRADVGCARGYVEMKPFRWSDARTVSCKQIGE
jgi:type I restriction enzyme M protein